MDSSEFDVQFKQAFDWATRDIAAPKTELATLFKGLLPLIGTPGRPEDIPAAGRIASEAFRLNGWRWLAYERFVHEGHAVEQLAEARVRIGELPDADVLADRMKLVQIKELALSEDVDIKGLRSKVAIAERILNASGPSARVRDMAAKYRDAMLHDVEQGIFDEMGELLVHRIQSKKYALNRDQSNFDPDLRSGLVGLRLSPIRDERTPRECIEESRTIRPVEDEFWKTHSVPCERLLCGCMITAIVIGSEEAKDFLSRQRSKD